MSRIAIVSLVVVLGTGPLAAARSWLPSRCKPRFEAAREVLIQRGFAPTRDRDTRRWLRVDERPSALSLTLEMRASADGPATGYRLWVEWPRVGHEGSSWRHQRRRLPRGEHAAAEDRLVELSWVRWNGWLRTTVSIVEVDSAGEDAQARTWREMFTEVAKAAADDCLSAKPDAGANVIP